MPQQQPFPPACLLSLLAMRLVAGTFGALAVMTVVSVGLGRVLHLLDEASGADLRVEVQLRGC